MEAKMDILAEQQLIENIREGRAFAAQLETGTLQLSIRRYVPFVATAIHDGHRVDSHFAAMMLVSDAERQFEEDPYTGAIAEGFDMSLRALDSRYCCDLNRRPEACIYEDAWGKRVWKEPLGGADRRQLLDGHARYYRVLDTLLTALTDRFAGVVLYDLHSYNYDRLDGDPPLFNIGTNFIDLDRYGATVNHLLEELQKIELPGYKTRAALDEVFRGRGYQAEHIRSNHPNVLCVPLEIKKVFMDEQSFELKQEVFAQLCSGVHTALARNSAFFRQSAAVRGG